MNGHNRLIRRNHTYYIRARIPVALVYLVHRQEFQYSLQTNNYYEALAKLSKESHKIDVKINMLKALDMLIKNKQLVILPEDIDKMVIHKLRQAEEVFENYDREIAEEKYDYQNLLVFNKETPEATTKAQHELECVELFIKEYFKDLKESTRTHHSIVKMIGRVDKEEIPIIADKTNPSEEIKQTARALKSVEKYVLDKSNKKDETKLELVRDIFQNDLNRKKVDDGNIIIPKDMVELLKSCLESWSKIKGKE